MWYRGRVVEEMDNDEFAVFFVDVGKERRIPLRELCYPLPRFIHLPAQAVEMYLNGVDRASDSEEARNQLTRLVKGRELVAHIVQTSPDVLVDLYGTVGWKQTNIAQQMIHRRVVRPAPVLEVSHHTSTTTITVG